MEKNYIKLETQDGGLLMDMEGDVNTLMNMLASGAAQLLRDNEHKMKGNLAENVAEFGKTIIEKYYKETY